MTSQSTTKYDLGADIVRVLREKGRMSTFQLLIHVSGTRPQVAAAVQILKAAGQVRAAEQQDEGRITQWEAV